MNHFIFSSAFLLFFSLDFLFFRMPRKKLSKVFEDIETEELENAFDNLAIVPPENHNDSGDEDIGAEDLVEQLDQLEFEDLPGNFFIFWIFQRFFRFSA